MGRNHLVRAQLAAAAPMMKSTMVRHQASAAILLSNCKEGPGTLKFTPVWRLIGTGRTRGRLS
jgi:hypothetical protein